MKVIDVNRQYFAADCVYNTVERKGALVTLTATSDSGEIKYEVGVTFFPHRDEEDYAISYDACAAKVLYQASGRRSKKREAEFLPNIPTYADEAAAELGGKIHWDRPLRDAQYA